MCKSENLKFLRYYYAPFEISFEADCYQKNNRIKFTKDGETREYNFYSGFKVFAKFTIFKYILAFLISLFFYSTDEISTMSYWLGFCVLFAALMVLRRYEIWVLAFSFFGALALALIVDFMYFTGFIKYSLILALIFEFMRDMFLCTVLEIRDVKKNKILTFALKYSTIFERKEKSEE